MTFNEDLEYWGVDDSLLEPCCQHKYQERKEAALNAIQLSSKSDDHDDSTNTNETADGQFEKCFPPTRQLIWSFMDYPRRGSLASRIFAIVSTFFVLLYTLIQVLGTLPELRVPDTQSAAKITLTWFFFNGD